MRLLYNTAMWPNLIEFGPLVISADGFFSTLAFLTTAFVFWKKTREEHYSSEQTFDVFLLATLVGLMTGRIGLIMLNWAEWSGDFWQWFNILGRPGSWLGLGILGATLFLYRQAKQHKWDIFEILDFWFLALTAGLVLESIGNFFAGTGFGFETNLPWGMVFPDVFARHHPVQLYLAIFHLALYIYLSWADYHYRTFSWYRAGKKTAEAGFLTSVFLVSTGLMNLLLQLIRPAQVIFYGLDLDLWLNLALVMTGLILFYQRSGHEFEGLKLFKGRSSDEEA